MHFWIDKRATSFQYGRRRPNFYSSGTFASSAFGRERNSIGSLRPSSSSTARSYGEEHAVRLSPRRYYYGESPNHHLHDQSRAERREHVFRHPRRPPSYPPIQDPAVQEALDELQQELQASLASSPPRGSPQSGRRFCFTTKHLGLSLCFMGLILLCTVAGKFIVEGPGVLDSSRRPSSSHLNTTEHTRTSVSFFLISEVIFVVFALGLFLTGVACLRKRTNEYLLRQFRQHIINTSHQSHNETGSHRSSGTTLISASDEEAGPPGDHSPGTLALYADASTRRERRSHRYILDGHPGRRCYNYSHKTHQLLQSKPPPYEVAIYLPLPNQHLPHHTNVPSTPTTAIQPCAGKDENEGVEEFACASEPETPPPSYEIQFSYEI